MADFQTYSPEDVIAENLRETAARTRTVWEQEMAHLRELAAQIAEGASLNTDFPHTLPDHSPPRFYELFEGIRANPRFGKQLEKLRSTEHSVYLCLELCEWIKRHAEKLSAEELFFEGEELDEHAKGRIAYQRSSYADSAYLRFAPLLDSPRALYAHSFSEVCEQVYNGLSEFCILPLESSAEGQLNSFSRLIDRFELKTVATCDIPATDGVRSTRFALLRRDAVLLPVPAEIKNRFFECSAPLDSTPSPAQLLCAAQLCGLELFRVDSRATTDEDLPPVRRMHYVFRVERGELLAFLLYLSMEAPQCEPNGIYFHLEHESKGD